jgi:hypothetical protein
MLPTGALAARLLSEPLVYDAAHFERFKPSTALDMLRQTPGFVLDEGENVRGLAGGHGNVLINGRIQSTKTESLKTALTQIPANQVERIEIVDASATDLAGDRQGLVANVVRKLGRSPSGTFNIDLVGADAAGGITASLTTQSSLFGFDQVGSTRLYDQTTRNANGRYSLVTGRATAPTVLFDQSSMAGERIQGRLSLIRPSRRVEASITFDRDRGSALTDIRSSPELDGYTFRSRYGTKALETTISYGEERGNNVRLDATLLNSVDWKDYDDLARYTGYQGSSLYKSRESETVLKTTVARPLSASIGLSAGFEGALNRLRGRSSYREGALDVLLPSQNVEVSEHRGEAFARINQRLRDRWSYGAGVTLESARLTVGGDQHGSATFTYVRPDATLTYTPRQGDRVSLSATRGVSQLDFSDFVTSVGLKERTVALGNPELQPVRHWRLELSAHRTFWKDGALSLTIGAEQIANPQEFILLSGRDTAGNLGKAWRRQLSTGVTLPLERWRLTGAKVIATLQINRSRVLDPVTAIERRLSGETPVSGEFRFRYDPPGRPLSWGLDIQSGVQKVNYRVREVKTTTTAPYFGAEVEYRPSSRLSLKLRAQANGSQKVVRDLYNGRIPGSSPRSVERRYIPSNQLIYLAVLRRFG